MRSLVLLMLLLLPASASAGTDIIAICYQACEASTNSNPEYKACLARAADAADRKLNEAYKQLQGAIRAGAKAMGQRPDIQLSGLTSPQKKGIAYRDANCTFKDELAFGGTLIGGNYSACLCAPSYERIDDFARMRARLLFE
jgi:uncharacterized protein YecT (DUF1311 family)